MVEKGILRDNDTDESRSSAVVAASRTEFLCPPDFVSRIKGVFDEVLNFSRITSDVRMLIRRTKHELITKLIAQMESNSRDESIEANQSIISK